MRGLEMSLPFIDYSAKVNCPFMAKFVSPDNFAGNMRVDGNTGGKPVYV
jgi:hypothetical protein